MHWALVGNVSLRNSSRGGLIRCQHTKIAMAVGARWWHQARVIRRKQTVAELMALEAV